VAEGEGCCTPLWDLTTSSECWTSRLLCWPYAHATMGSRAGQRCATAANMQSQRTVLDTFCQSTCMVMQRWMRAAVRWCSERLGAVGGGAGSAGSSSRESASCRRCSRLRVWRALPLSRLGLALAGQADCLGLPRHGPRPPERLLRGRRQAGVRLELPTVHVPRTAGSG
jgi:hypothetical protein